MRKLVLQITLSLQLIFMSSVLLANNYYISPKGNDNNEGTLEHPFATIQKAASMMKAGDVCYIREGIYHETVTPVNSGTKDMPIRFQAYKGENVILDGTKTITANWKPYKDGIYKTTVDANKIEQLFANTQMMTEAR